jgi:hypothetical protein
MTSAGIKKENGAASTAAPPAKGRYIIAYISEGLPREAPLTISAKCNGSLENCEASGSRLSDLFLFSHYFYYFFGNFELTRHEQAG